MLEGTDLIRIHQLLSAYGHALDDLDWDSLASFFAPDAELDYTAVGAASIWHGTAEILEYFRQARHPSAHHVINIVVDDAADPDGRVAVRSKFFVPFTRDTNLPARLYGGGYRDEVVRSSAGWQFAKRVCVGRWQLTPTADDDVPASRRTY